MGDCAFLEPASLQRQKPLCYPEYTTPILSIKQLILRANNLLAFSSVILKTSAMTHQAPHPSGNLKHSG